MKNQATSSTPRADYFERLAAANLAAAEKMTTPEFKNALIENAQAAQEAAENWRQLETWQQAGAPGDWWD